jgi:four helix bundle protein
MTEQQLKIRTKNFAHRCVKLALSLPVTILGKHLTNQLIRCSTSVAANYRAACIAQSKASFIAKISIVLEEVDEASFWLDFISDEKLAEKKLSIPLINEANELKAIFYKSRKTARTNKTP